MYELQQLESFLNEKKQPNQETLKTEQKRIEQAFLEYLYDDHPNDKLEIYVKQHAQSLIHILEELERKKKTELLPIVQQLLVFLERHGQPYWNYRLAVPEFLKTPVLEIIKVSLPLVRSKFLFLQIELPFEPVFIADIEKLINQPVLEYGQLYLLKWVMAALLELPNIDEEATDEIKEDGKRQFREILCRYNFNSLAVYGYATARIIKEEQKEKDDPIFRLTRMQQFYDGIKVEKGVFYQSHRPPLTEMISGFILARIDSRRRELQIMEKATGSTGPDSQFVNTTLTVEKLGFMLRLFIDVAVFRVRNWKGLARFMAKNVITVTKTGKEQNEAGSDGLYTNMYSPTLKTIMQVIDIIEKMHRRAMIWKNAVKNTGKPPAKVEE